MTNLSLQAVEVIRKTLRMRRISILQFSKMLHVSEPTMKRWLKGKGLLLDNWSRMLTSLDISPSEIMAELGASGRQQFEYTEKQEAAFSAMPGLLAFFQQLQEGLSASEVMKKHKLSLASTSYYLKKLDDMGLIRWGQGLHTDLLKKGEPKWKKNGALAKKFKAQVFNELVFANKDSESFRMGIYRLTASDFEKLQEMESEIFKFAKSAEVRSQIMHEKSKSIGVCAFSTEYQPDFLYTVPNIKK